ncbi:MAG: GTPase ObgE [Spirochaetota bacterium]
MSKFTDSIEVRIRAGNGGAGSVSFRREKYVPKGGPDGGDGGKGGDVYIMADRRFYNLSHLFKDRLYHAKPGDAGLGRRKHGSDGEDLTIMVPPGTQVHDAETGELICDLVDELTPVCIAKGGVGGLGNTFYKSSTLQTPKFAQHGMPGEERTVILDLKLIADVGIIGLPNAGKSTLLSKLTNAQPKIADYPFTTLIPNLGVVTRPDGREYKIADIPGIIEGAHLGQGLGLSFLAHIERVKVIVYLIDASSEDPKYVYTLLRDELVSYNKMLADKEHCIILSKTDLADPQTVKKAAKLFGKKKVIPVSSETGENLDLLLDQIDILLGD